MGKSTALFAIIPLHTYNNEHKSIIQEKKIIHRGSLSFVFELHGNKNLNYEYSNFSISHMK